jgi:hypothetical protein
MILSHALSVDPFIMGKYLFGESLVIVRVDEVPSVEVPPTQTSTDGWVELPLKSEER